MNWEQIQEEMAFIRESIKSHDDQISRMAEKVDNLREIVKEHQINFKEFQEDRIQINNTLRSVIEQMAERDKVADARAAAADARNAAADARMARLEKLFERSISRGKNGHSE